MRHTNTDSIADGNTDPHANAYTNSYSYTNTYCYTSCNT